jgi:hypothetical protein
MRKMPDIIPNHITSNALKMIGEERPLAQQVVSAQKGVAQ